MSTKPNSRLYEEKSDEELALASQQEDVQAQEELIGRYKYFVRSKARGYFLIGADKEDIIQEGMIGLYKAIRDYNHQRESSFKAFADLCITRQIITAIKTATRQKHMPLNSYVSLNKTLYDEDSDRTLEELILSEHNNNPESMMINREELKDVFAKMNKALSPLEKKVLALYLEGASYLDIAEILGRHAKSVDNALQRVKKKLENYLAKKEI